MPLFRQDGLGAAAAPFVAGVAGVDFGQHARKALPRRDDLHSAVLEIYPGHRPMTGLQSPVDDELGLRLTVGVDELVEDMVGADDAAPDVEQGLLTDDRALFSQAFLLLS